MLNLLRARRIGNRHLIHVAPHLLEVNPHAVASPLELTRDGQHSRLAVPLVADEHVPTRRARPLPRRARAQLALWGGEGWADSACLSAGGPPAGTGPGARPGRGPVLAPTCRRERHVGARHDAAWAARLLLEGELGTRGARFRAEARFRRLECTWSEGGGGSRAQRHWRGCGAAGERGLGSERGLAPPQFRGRRRRGMRGVEA